MAHFDFKDSSSRKSGFILLFGAQGEYCDKHIIKGCNLCSFLFNLTLNLICRSGDEGFYPDLIEFTEEKLREINPKR